jgi:hypothetical protein
MNTRHWIVSLTTLAAATLVGCGAASQEQPEPAPPDQETEADPSTAAPTEPPAAPTENYGPAPEITNDVWLNTDAPIRLADQRGKVVLIEFWTFG